MTQLLSRFFFVCADGEVLAPAPKMTTPGSTKFSKSLDLLGFAPPSYLVCSDILKADLLAYKSVLGQSEASCWQKCFSATLVLSSLLPIGLPLGEPFLHCPGARIESYGSWNRQSSYFHSIQGMVCHHLFYSVYFSLIYTHATVNWSAGITLFIIIVSTAEIELILLILLLGSSLSFLRLFS